MTPDQYRREGADAMREAAADHCWSKRDLLADAEKRQSDVGLSGREYYGRRLEAELLSMSIRAIDVDEVLAKVGANEPEWPVKPCPDCGAQPARVWRPGGAFQMRTECACGRVTNWVMCGHDAVADSDDDTPQPAPDAVARLVEAARTEAEKAMRKFPQPNYVISKVAEEAGEVVKAAIHCAEGRETPENVKLEIVQAMAMLIRLYVEGDQVHGLPALAAMEIHHDHD